MLPGPVCAVGDSDRGESCSAPRSPREERPEVAQLRKVNLSNHLQVLRRVKVWLTLLLVLRRWRLS